MKKLYIAEKRDVAEAIAAVLGVTKKASGVIHCGEDAICWCSGHILELCAPEDYNPDHGAWKLDHLPIINIPWRYKVIDSKRASYKQICELIKEAETIVHAGDTDAEGQLLVDEILTHQQVTKPVKRVLINDNNPRIVRRSLDNMRDNRDFAGLSKSALARSVGDQLYGFNLTRLYTLLARAKGANGVLSVGRVQTPILGLIVARDRQIESHEKHFYHLLKGQFSVCGTDFQALYQPTEADTVDDKGRLTDKDQAQAIAQQCEGAAASIDSAATKEKREAPPLPYDLLGLQSDAYRKFGLSAKRTLEITQRLREKKLITYNRTDCRYLSDDQHQDAPIVLATIAKNAPMLAGAAGSADPSIKGKAFDSSKVTAHHGMVPAEGEYSVSDLPSEEQKIYLLIARQYIAQFWPAKVTEVTTVLVNVDSKLFKASSGIVTHPGWSRLYKNDADNDDVAETKNDDDTSTNLQALAAGQGGQCTATTIDDKETKPPSHYTEATLLKDLRRVAKYVKDERIAALLREKDKDSKEEQGGIGTPATRHSFIETLKDRGFIDAKKGKLISTTLGREFHDQLPELATQPDMTALWYEQQTRIEAGEMALDAFLDELVEQVSRHVDDMKGQGIAIKANLGPACPECKEGHLARRKGKHGWFWPCTRYPDCKASFPDKAGKPNLAPKKATETEHKCGECDSPLIRRPAKKKGKYWYGCSAFPKCKARYFEKNNKPDYQPQPASAGAN